MKRIAAILLLVAVGASPAWAAYRRFSESQALTRAAPTNPASADANGLYSDTEGVDLAGATGYRVCVSATSGNTLSGGTIKQYVFSHEDGLWGENPLLAQTVTSTTRKQCWDYKVTVGRGRVLPATSAVTVSAGASVTVTVLVWYAK